MRVGKLYRPPAKRRAATKRTKPEGDTHPGPERAFQVVAIDHVRLMCKLKGVHPDRVMHVPNGGKRHAIEAKNLKRQGVVPGYPDIMVFCRGANHVGLAIELKVWPGKTTEQQDHIHDLLKIAGWLVRVCYGVGQVRDAVVEHFDGPVTKVSGTGPGSVHL